MVLSIKNTEGVVTEVTISTTTPLMRTLRGGLSFRLGDLITCAETGKLDQETLAESPALGKMTQAQAIEELEDMVRAESPYIQVEANTEKGDDDKAKKGDGKAK